MTAVYVYDCLSLLSVRLMHSGMINYTKVPYTSDGTCAIGVEKACCDIVCCVCVVCVLSVCDGTGVFICLVIRYLLIHPVCVGIHTGTTGRGWCT